MEKQNLEGDDECYVDKFWYTMGGSYLSANYILNKLPQKKLNKTPYELWNG